MDSKFDNLVHCNKSDKYMYSLFLLQHMIHHLNMGYYSKDLVFDNWFQSSNLNIDRCKKNLQPHNYRRLYMGYYSKD